MNPQDVVIPKINKSLTSIENNNDQSERIYIQINGRDNIKYNEKEYLIKEKDIQNSYNENVR